ncbi:MAG: hypothetical protein HQL31_01670 [Planctomycetes bacterium]|nr:hypothetical protein [Planctomycetota bacterium]
MLPEYQLIIKIFVIVLLVMGITVTFGVIFQSLLFQRYRLHKNEAALRKTRLHDAAVSNRIYKAELLGAIEESTDPQEEA